MNGVRSFFKTFVILIALSGALGYSNPLKDPNICGRPECSEEDGKFQYGTKKVFRYDYRMHIKSEFAGSGQNTSEMFLTAQVELEFHKKCEGVLKMNSIEFRERVVPEIPEDLDEDPQDYVEPEEIELHPMNDHMADDIYRNNLRFSFHDGVIGEVCPDESEPVWVLNFKKGILSAMQNTMVRFDVDHNTTEVDVSGKCDVVYTLTDTHDTSLLIQKIKDITSCRNRYKMNSVLQTTPYDFRENYAAWPILKSDSYCNISIDHSIYNHVSCYERHQMVPFSNGHYGAVTESFIKLKLTDEDTIYEDPDNIEGPPPIVKRSSLLFDHTPSKRQPHGEIKTTRDLLKEMCKYGTPDIQREFPDVFTSFLANAKLLSYVALHQLLTRASSICTHGKQHVLESLPYIGSAASVQLMKEQILQNQVTEIVGYSWMVSMSLMIRPDTNMLESLFELLQYGRSKNYHSFTLGASAVAHTFCRQNPECAEVPEIETIVKYLENDIQTNIPKLSKRGEREQMIIFLKALGNIGVITEDFEDFLKKMIENEKLELEIRLQAVSAFRRFNCEATKEYFIDTFRNYLNDPEIRIASYLQSMKCPDYQTINSIKFVLENEEVNQVGSFVWSHLNNVAKSASPVRVFTQGLLVGSELSKKFKLDIRKFSRNFEESVFFDEYNFGANAESNLIFGTDSYLPRTLSFNLTFDLFGESVNIFEVNTRMQGFEKFIESYFGPKGPVNAKRFVKKFDEYTNLARGFLAGENIPTIDELSEFNDPSNIIEKAREIRDDITEFSDEEFIEDETEELKRQRMSPSKKSLNKRVDDLGHKLKYQFDEPHASFGLKIFGNDLQYSTIDGVSEVFKAANVFNPSYITKLLSEKEFTYTKSGVILDASYTVPLSSGLPLSLTALGATSLDIRLSGLWNNPGFFKTQQLDVEARIKPSISLNVLTTMQSDFFHGISGIRVKSNLYSSSSIETKLKIRGTKLISLHVSLPQDRNEIFSAKSELLVMKHDEDISQPGIPHRYQNQTCTWPVINAAVGLKMCADYELPDVSNSTKQPSLILSGPVYLDINLDKADRTAKTYVFEYRSNKTKHTNKRTFTFETPGSAIVRKILANIDNDRDQYNVTMSFENGKNRHTAVGIYRDTEEDKRLEFALKLNGQENFAVEMGYNKTNIRNGAIYYPVFFLAVEQEKIAGLTGVIRKTEKNDKLQYDVDVTFETKRMQSKLIGFLTRTEASYATKLNLSYKFVDDPIQQILIEANYADRSQKGRADITGDFKHVSTAYPQYNFITRIKLLAAMGHIDAKLDYNNAPDFENPKYTLGTRFTFGRNMDRGQGKTKMSFEIARPISNIDVKLLLKHEDRFKNGTENNFMILLRYSPKQEATAVFSVYHPHGVLYAIDTVANITVPGFQPCVVNFNIRETSRKEYNFDFKGTWFSGHALNLNGLYQDRSSMVKTFHHLKLLAQSPSFVDTVVDIKYARDKLEFKIDVHVEHGADTYGLILRKSKPGENQVVSYGEVKWRQQLYWINANMLSGQPKELNIEIHLDKERDIQLILRGVSNDLKRHAGIEFKWNANRDPSQKLAISGEFNTPRPKYYDGEFLLTYPNRTFTGTFDIFVGGPEYNGKSRISWSSNEVIEFKFGSGTRLAEAKDLWFWATLTTPFEGWRSNKINTGLYYVDNLLMLNSSVNWADNQHLGIEFFGDYILNADQFNVEVKTAINSTVKDVPTLSAYIKHNQNISRITTDITFKKLPVNEQFQIFSIRSAWQFDDNYEYRNVSGSIALKTPFERYKDGALVTKFSLSADKKLLGAADIEIENRKYTLGVDGHIKKITDCMLLINVTTPIEKFRHIVGRFGINERDKHIVAEIRGPAQALGAELLLSVVSSTEFDIKFSLETPLEAFEKLILIGKKKPKTIDFRCGFNKFMMGFVGIWRMNSYSDFEYSYKAYTPLKNFEENGVVARFVRGTDWDFETTIKLAQYKLGLLVLGQPKPELFDKLKLAEPFKKHSDFFAGDFHEKPFGDEEEETDDDDDDPYVELSYTGYMELDLIVFPTIKGDLRLAEADFTYLCNGHLLLPHGEIEIYDRFFYPDILTIKNELLISTPYPWAKELKSVYHSSIDIFKMYTAGFDVSILSKGNWINSGIFLNLTNSTDSESELRLTDVTIKIHTPLEKLPELNLRTLIETEENAYRANFTGRTQFTVVSVSGSIEHDINYVDAVIGFSLQTPLVPHYTCKVFVKKDFSDVENTLDAGFHLNDNGADNKLEIKTMWHIDQPNYLNAVAKVYTNLLPIRFLETQVLLSRAPHPVASIEMLYHDNTEHESHFKARVIRKKEIVSLDVFTPLSEFRNISMVATLTEQPSQGKYRVAGNLYKNADVYYVEGETTIVGDIPIDMNLILKPGNGEANGAITYSLKDTDNGKSLNARVFRGNRYAALVGNFATQSKFNWNYFVELKSSEPQIAQVSVNADCSMDSSNMITGKYRLKTPWEDLGIDSVLMDTRVQILSYSGEMSTKYELTHVKSDGRCTWSWLPGENMQVSLISQTERKGNDLKLFKASAKYLNPHKNFSRLTTGADINVNSLWIIGTNGSFIYSPTSDSIGTIVLSLPEPAAEVHHLSGRFHANNENVDEYENYAFEMKYDADLAKRRFSTRGQYRNTSDVQGLMRIEWGHIDDSDAIEANLHMLRKGVRREFAARLFTPFYDEDTFKASGSYDSDRVYEKYAGKVFYPASRQVANTDVAFNTLADTKGIFNCTTPFLNISWFQTDFDFNTEGGRAEKIIKTTWPDDSATFKATSLTTVNGEDTDLNVVIHMEVPIQTRHYININYDTKEKSNLKLGNVSVDYMNEKIVNGNYKYVSEFKNSIEVETVDIAVENKLKPLGIHYVHSVDDRDKTNSNYLSVKRVELFELNKSNFFNITCELHNKTTKTGQEFTMIAIHPNRTVILTADYDYQDSKTKQRTKLQLAPTVWLAYNFNSRNETHGDKDSQVFSLELSYPKRNLTADGWYVLTSHSMDSNVEFKWVKNVVKTTDDENTDDDDGYGYGYGNDDDENDLKPRVMSAQLIWKNESNLIDNETKHSVLFGILHPSFVKNVTFKGSYFKNKQFMFKTDFEVEYCDEPEQLLVLGMSTEDLSETTGYRNYTLNLYAYHNYTELALDGRGSVGVANGLYKSHGRADYKRSYLPEQNGVIMTLVDLNDKEMHMYKKTPNKEGRLWLHAKGGFPIYRLNGTVLDTIDEIDTNGYFYFNFDQKFIRMDINLTQDASQNLQMIGVIPDARSASFNMWRDYEDIRIVDVAYYLRMNHSRLVTSKLKWRPEIKNDLKEKIKVQAASFYDGLTEGLDFWKKTINTEIQEARKDVWLSAKEYTQGFLDDIGGLTVIKEDLEELHEFLNQSYGANDFYIRSVVNFTLNVLDELALKHHIESVPQIFGELIEAMGESGKALKESIDLLIETIKESYQKAVEVIEKILHGETLEHLSGLMENAVGKYDKWIKDLHLSLIKHVENLYTKITYMLTNSWKRMLQNIEPTIITFAHYVESTTWKLSKEIFDFLYQRSNELVDSPYFTQVSNFTKDLDHFYRDIMNNDAVTNFKKYSVVAYDFLKEKYFRLVPFGKELHNIITEVYDELKKLQTREPFNIVIQKYNDVRMQVQWFADEFKLEERLQQVWTMMRHKLNRFAQTALQTDSRYREAKSKFIFDPDHGVLELEQKLPMSWHAFNETPKFEEIPEYKMIHDVQNLLAGSNETIWEFYHDVKHFADPSTWLPPFKAHAFLIGSRQYITFDQKFVSLDLKYEIINDGHKPNQCSYLLVKDFFNLNFTLAIEPTTIVNKHNDIISSRKYTIISDEDVITIEVVGDQLRIGDNVTALLPIRIKDVIIHRDTDVLTIDSVNGFKLHCNIQFDYCSLELSGWYFGKTAGLLGTMNNERYDDYLMASNKITNDQQEFVNSWALSGCENMAPVQNYTHVMETASMEVISLCDSFFKNRVSYFAPCFSVIDPTPFYDMCLDLGMNSMSNVIYDDHPSQRGFCTSTLAYIDVCTNAATPLRVPDNCVHCDLNNGSYVQEGEFVMMREQDIPLTTDVVFIIEAKPCNKDFVTAKSFMTVVGSLNKEFEDSGLKNNRYSVIVFGGKSPFDQTRTVVYNGKEFTSDYRNLIHYFNHIKTGMGKNNDVFQAIAAATKLVFRPGASKTLILLPCSECSDEMRLDYSSIVQLLLENGITLHVLMDDDFLFDKQRLNKMFFGIDRRYAYSKNDFNVLKGDPELRKQVRLPKKSLGLCAPLAIETNGTVFTARKLRPEKRNPVKKLSTVLAKRVAQTARPHPCQTCECTGHNTGVAYVTCLPCAFPSPLNIDYYITDDDEDDNDGWNWEDDDDMTSDFF